MLNFNTTIGFKISHIFYINIVVAMLMNSEKKTNIISIEIILFDYKLI